MSNNSLSAFLSVAALLSHDSMLNDQRAVSAFVAYAIEGRQPTLSAKDILSPKADYKAADTARKNWRRWIGAANLALAAHGETLSALVAEGAALDEAAMAKGGAAWRYESYLPLAAMGAYERSKIGPIFEFLFWAGNRRRFDAKPEKGAYASLEAMTKALKPAKLSPEETIAAAKMALADAVESGDDNAIAAAKDNLAKLRNDASNAELDATRKAVEGIGADRLDLALDMILERMSGGNGEARAALLMGKLGDVPTVHLLDALPKDKAQDILALGEARAARNLREAAAQELQTERDNSARIMREAAENHAVEVARLHAEIAAAKAGAKPGAKPGAKRQKAAA